MAEKTENQTDLTRRDWLKATVGFSAAAMSVRRASLFLEAEPTAEGVAPPGNGPEKPRALTEIDHRALLARSDLIYRSPVAQPIEGQPIGNGIMGTLVWTTPSAIHLQINRSDVFAVNKEHRAGVQFGATDYCGACAQVTIEVGGDIFSAGKDFEQRLMVYEASVAITTKELRVGCFVSAERDVLVLEIDDQRPHPAPVRITLRHWRPASVTTGDHTASWQFVDGSEGLLLAQRFVEREFHSASAVAVQVVGRGQATITRDNFSQTMEFPARRGVTLFLVSSAASQESQADVTRRAQDVIKLAAALSFHELGRSHLAWWSEFWSRTYVHLASTDGVADFMERVRNLHLYFMASTSRGEWPAKWNGSLWTTEGDARQWGSQYWVWTTEISYWPLHSADATDLTNPFFEMYLRQLPDCQRAARQRWGVGGAFYPETTPLDGPLVLPEEIAREFQSVYLGRQKRTLLSESARRLGQFDASLYTFVMGASKGYDPEETGAGRYNWISHICSSGAELAVQAWWRFRHTGDKMWLRSHAYPLLRETAEFYRQLVYRGEDGRYHLRGTNAHEDFWGVTDSIMDLAAIRGTVPLALKAATILDIDDHLRAPWQDLLDHLTAYPMGSDAQAQALTGAVLADDVWLAGHRGEVDGQHNPEDVWLNPVFPFEDWTLATHQPSTDRIVQKLLDLAPRHSEVLGGAKLSTAIRTPIAMVRAGRGNDLPHILASYYSAFSPLCNGLSLFEGQNAQSVEHLALLSMTVQEALLQSVSPRPGEPEVIYVFPAWPTEWEATYRLLARGGFLITTVIEKGHIAFIELESRLGEDCRLHNPWRKPVRISVVSPTGQIISVIELEGEVLKFETKPGELYRVVPAEGISPTPRRVSPPPATGPACYVSTLPSGAVVKGMLGRI